MSRLLAKKSLRRFPNRVSPSSNGTCFGSTISWVRVPPFGPFMTTSEMFVVGKKLKLKRGTYTFTGVVVMRQFSDRPEPVLFLQDVRDGDRGYVLTDNTAEIFEIEVL